MQGKAHRPFADNMSLIRGNRGSEEFITCAGSWSQSHRYWMRAEYIRGKLCSEIQVVASYIIWNIISHWHL